MIEWQETQSGFVAGRYAIVGIGPFRWQLVVAGRPRSEHRTASATKVEAARLEGRRRRNASLARIAAALGVVAILLGVAVAMRFEHNPARDEAAALTAEMERAYNAIQSGAAVAADYSGSDVRGASIVLPYEVEVSVLWGEAGGECYVSYWNPDGFRRARVLADVYPCEPGPFIASQNEHSYKRRAPLESWHFPLVQGDFDWERVLPGETRQRVWFLPAILVLSAVALSLVMRAAVTLLAGTKPTRG